MILFDFRIIAFCFHLHFTQHLTSNWGCTVIYEFFQTFRRTLEKKRCFGFFKIILFVYWWLSAVMRHRPGSPEWESNLYFVRSISCVQIERQAGGIWMGVLLVLWWLQIANSSTPWLFMSARVTHMFTVLTFPVLLLLHRRVSLSVSVEGCFLLFTLCHFIHRQVVMWERREG